MTNPDSPGRPALPGEPTAHRGTSRFYQIPAAEPRCQRRQGTPQKPPAAVCGCGACDRRQEPDQHAELRPARPHDPAGRDRHDLASATITAGPSAGYQRSFAYDSLGRPVQATATISSTNYSFYASYDANSRLSTVTYPSGFVADFVQSATVPTF
jgi:hypothetical protein